MPATERPVENLGSGLRVVAGVAEFRLGDRGCPADPCGWQALQSPSATGDGNGRPGRLILRAKV